MLIGSSSCRSSDCERVHIDGSANRSLVFLCLVYILRPRTNLIYGDFSWLRQRKRPRRKLRRRSKGLYFEAGGNQISHAWLKAETVPAKAGTVISKGGKQGTFRSRAEAAARRSGAWI